jgi:plasmid stabilization system protein ParE
MNFGLTLKEEAQQEIIEAYRWYDNKQSGLGDVFLDEIEKYLNIISKNPSLFSVRHNNKRAAVLRRFPYLIAYEQVGDRVIVYAVFNTNQNPHKLRRG